MNSINDIHSYNSLTNDINSGKHSTTMKTAKYNIRNEFKDILKKQDMHDYSNYPPKIGIISDKMFSSTQNLNVKDDESTSSTITKLPKIHGVMTSSTLSARNSTNTNSQIGSFINSNLQINRNNIIKGLNISKKSNKYVNSNKNKNYCYYNYYKYNNNGNNNNNNNEFISPPDPLIKRTLAPKINPKFGKMKEYICLPEFKGQEPLTKFQYKPTSKNIYLYPPNEKQYEANLYINRNKMISNLVYLKAPLNKDGFINLDNLVNVKKLNKYYSRNETDEDDEFFRYIEPNNSTNNILENQIMFDNSVNHSSNQIARSGSSIYSNMTKGKKTPKHELKPFYSLKNKYDDTLIFESRFESGNLLCAFKTDDPNSYQLYLQNDTNTTGYIQWFFFRVSNTRKGRKANFIIINMLRKTCLYNNGMKIMTYSTMEAKNENLGWHRDCFNIMYYPNNLFIYNNNNLSKKRNCYSLSFDYEFKYDNDVVYFANCIPYFYSTLMKELNEYEMDEDQYPFFQRKTITATLGGNDLDMFTINSRNDIYKDGIKTIVTTKSPNYKFLKKNVDNNLDELKNQILDERKAIIIFARQHPGETVGSYVVRGMTEFLLGKSEEAQKLREIYLFKIIPMMNPDGVLVGNSRTSFAGCDLNRRWIKPNEVIHPEVFKTKQIILKLASQRNIGFIIDCHGHFGTFNALFYGNHKEDEAKCQLFPYINCKLSKIINFQQCSFAMPKYKLSTGRISLFNELEDEDTNNIVALETSFFGTNRPGQYNNTFYNTDILKEIGRNVCLGILAYSYKYENIKIDNINILKNLMVDMREFESDIIHEVDEDNNDENGCNEERSESEPSVDNLDKNQIMKLMPNHNNKKKKKKKIINNRYKKLEKIEKKTDYLNRNIDIELYNPNKESKKEEEKKNKLFNSKNLLYIIKNRRLNKDRILTETNTKNDYTQTEEIFFKMHWSYFSGKYKILGAKFNQNKDTIINNHKNNIKVSQNILAKLVNNSNIISKIKIDNTQNKENDNKSSKSLNKILVSNKNGISLVHNGKIYNIKNNIFKSTNNMFNIAKIKEKISRRDLNNIENNKDKKILENERYMNILMNNKITKVNKKLKNIENIKVQNIEKQNNNSKENIIDDKKNLAHIIKNSKNLNYDNNSKEAS